VLSTTASSRADAESLNRCSGDEKLEHLVVVFDENVSFDHYFGTYPNADPPFNAKPDTPSVDGLNTPGLWENNPNSTKPFRLRRDQYATSDQDHDFPAEQEAFDNGLMDLFPESTGETGNGPDWGKGKGIVMGVYDGNTVTALWNYAQNFAMSDNSSVTDQSSVIRYIEDRWLGGTRLGNGSTDKNAGTLCNMFDFTRAKHADPIFLDPDAGTLTTRNNLRTAEYNDRSTRLTPLKPSPTM